MLGGQTTKKAGVGFFLVWGLRYNKPVMRHLRPVGSSNEPSWPNKIIIALTYTLLGGIVAVNAVQTQGLLMLFMLVGFLYWLFIGRNPYSHKYFVRFHLVQAIILNLCLATVLWLFVEVVRLLMMMLPIELLVTLLFEPLNMAGIQASVVQMFIFSIALVLAGYALMGREVEVPWISDGVRHWVR